MNIDPHWLGSRSGVIGRRVVLGNPLDHDASTLLCAELMTLDGESTDAVDLLVGGTGGPVDCLLPVADTIAAMRAPVNTRATGLASGTAGCLVALGTGRRTMAPHALLSLRVNRPAAASDRSVETLDTLAALHRQQRAALAQLLARRTGRSPDAITLELEAGDLHSPAEAVSRGLVDPPPT